MYYLKCGFKITTLHTDGKFSPLQELIQKMLGGPRLTLESDNEHVAEIEKQIQVTEERIRSIRQSLLFNKDPKLFLIHSVFQAIKMLNHFPINGGVSDMISPRKIMRGKSIHY